MSDLRHRSGEQGIGTGPTALTRASLMRRAAAAGLLLGSPALATACGSGSSSGSSPSATTRRRGGNLRVGSTGGSPTETLDAHLGSSVGYPSIARCHQLYDCLAGYTHDFDFVYALAEEISPNTTADVWTVRLRPDVVFHDGRPLTAADVAFSIARIVDPKLPKDGADSLAMIDIKAMKVLDNLTLRLPLHYPYSVLADSFAQYYNGIVPQGYDPKRPIGTGPFKYKSFTPGQESVFTKNQHYWRHGEPYVDEVTIIDFPEASARVNALLGGQLDAIDGLPAAQISAVKNQGQLSVLNSETGGSIPFTMRTDQAPFKDVRVRQAMRLLIDRPQTIEQALSGYGRVGNDMWAPYDPAYPDLPQRHQDIPRAKSLLKQAGYSDLSITLNTSDGLAGGVLEAASSFASQAKQAGVNINVQNLPASGFYAHYLSWTFSQTFWFTRNYIPQIAESELPTSSYNETHFNNSRFNRLFGEALRTLDQSKRSEILGECMRIDYNDGGYIIWGFDNVIDGYSNKVRGFVPDKSGAPLSQYGFREVYFT